MAHHRRSGVSHTAGAVACALAMRWAATELRVRPPSTLGSAVPGSERSRSRISGVGQSQHNLHGSSGGGGGGGADDDTQCTPVYNLLPALGYLTRGCSGVFEAAHRDGIGPFDRPHAVATAGECDRRAA